MTHSVTVVAFPGISPFHLSVPCLILGDEFEPSERSRYAITVCAEEPGTLPTNAGFELHVTHGLDAIDTADTVIVPSWDPQMAAPDALLSGLHRAHDRGARIVGLCLGAFPIAASGVADGRDVVTHWAWTDQLARQHPNVVVRSDVLWSDHGDLITSAGVAAALDCCLHLVREDFGADVAARRARRMVLAPHRAGSQAQFIPAPVPASDSGDPVEQAMVWARQRIDRPVSLDEWSGHAGMSRSTFTRRFRARSGTSPGTWLLNQRLDHARRLLESTDASIEQVARLSGFATAVSLRHHFAKSLGTSPRHYRAEFNALPQAV